MTLCCFSWIREVVDLLIVEKRLDISVFPKEIIIEILARLPAKDILKCKTLCRQWESLTSTSLFIDIHLKRANPSLLMQFTVNGVHSKEFICHEDADKKLKCSAIHSKPLKDLSQYNPCLVGSFHGPLLFEASIQIATKFFVINPATEEHISVIPPLKPVTPCSIFFHPTTRDYIVLFWHHHRHQSHNNPHPPFCYRYLSYSLRAKTWKEITPCFSYRPTLNAVSTVLVKGCLHWMVRCHFDDAAKIPACKHAIMVYSIANEEFHAMPHPGPQCHTLRIRHQCMSLFEREEEVIFVHVDKKTPVINIWVLEDYKKLGWVKRYEVDLGWMNSDIRYPIVVQWLKSRHPNVIRPLHLQNDELLFDWTSKGIFIYNLKLKRVWKIAVTTGMDREHERFGMVVTYTESIVSP